MLGLGALGPDQLGIRDLAERAAQPPHRGLKKRLLVRLPGGVVMAQIGERPLVRSCCACFQDVAQTVYLRWAVAAGLSERYSYRPGFAQGASATAARAV